MPRGAGGLSGLSSRFGNVDPVLQEQLEHHDAAMKLSDDRITAAVQYKFDQVRSRVSWLESYALTLAPALARHALLQTSSRGYAAGCFCLRAGGCSLKMVFIFLPPPPFHHPRPLFVPALLANPPPLPPPPRSCPNNLEQVHQALLREKKAREDDAERLLALYETMVSFFFFVNKSFSNLFHFAGFFSLGSSSMYYGFFFETGVSWCCP